ncbi:hypothetical protein EDM54_12935 [Brevibacillus borstelensis]|nr:hypothetical protein EDM54_12935 [Brevibacillus borstelensis]
MMSENRIVPFPELDRAVEEYLNSLTAKNIEAVALANEVTALSDDLFIKSVLLTDEVELVHFHQICLASRLHYTPVETNRIGARSIRIYTEYLDKKNAPS